MPLTNVKDIEANTIEYMEFRGKHFPNFENIEDILSKLPNLPVRDDDIMILAYPKSGGMDERLLLEKGTHWMWEIINMLTTGEQASALRNKGEGMIEEVSQETLGAMSSVRLLNTHVTPDFYPKELIEKKSKIIYVLRNPKDVFVSYFHFTKKLKIYNYQGTWNGYFNLLMDRKNDYGSWFDFTKSWNKFFKQYPQVPVLKMYYEEMKKDLSSCIKRISDFLELQCDPRFVDTIVDTCSFGNMVNAHQEIREEFKKRIVGNAHPVYRKGIVGDWKSLFTVAQNERFNAEYKAEMDGWSFPFEQYM